MIRRFKQNHKNESHSSGHSYVMKLILASAIFALVLTLCAMPVAADAEWTPIEHLGEIEGSGNYILTKNIDLPGPWYVPDKIINLDLNGMVIDGPIHVEEGAELNISDSNTTTHYFDKDGSGKWILNDANTGSPFKVTGGVITGVDGALVGGVLVNGTFVLSGGNIVGNNAIMGGGVAVNEGGSFTLSGGSIVGNIAQFGGGVCLSNSSFTMVEGEISDNIADFGGGVYNDNGFVSVGGIIIDNCATYNGGGMFVSSDGQVVMNGGSIVNNTADVSGGGAFVDNSNLTLIDGTIALNNAKIMSGGVNVNGSSFVMNGGNICDNYAPYAGGIGVVFGGNATINDGFVQLNNATMAGGIGVYESNLTIYGGNITNNTAIGVDNSSGGGVLLVYGGNITINGGNIEDNYAVYGGGLFVLDNGTVLMNGGNVINNSAEYGGGAYIEDSNLTLNDGNIAKNSALDGAGVYMDDGFGFMYGGNIENNYGFHGSGMFISDSGHVIMDGGNIAGNNAMNGGGVAVNNSVFVMKNGSIQDNVAYTGSEEDDSYGGGLFASNDGFIVILDGNITNNTAIYGGGVLVDGSSFAMKGGNIDGNAATYAGGIGIANDSNAGIENGSVQNNFAFYGGGVAISEANFSMTGGYIKNNNASGEHTSSGGGVLMVYGGNITIDGGYIEDNSATFGGGMFVLTNGTVIMNGGNITSNNADFGGGMYMELSGLMIANGNIAKNSADYGAGICLDGCYVMMTGGNITSNTGEFGSGVYVDDSIFTMAGDATVNADNSIYLESGEESGDIISLIGSNFTGSALNIEGYGFEIGRPIVHMLDDTPASAVINQFKHKKDRIKFEANEADDALIISKDSKIATKVVITNLTETLKPSEKFQFEAVVLDQFNETLPDEADSITWECRNPEVGTINETGFFTSNESCKAGYTYIKALSGNLESEKLLVQIYDEIKPTDIGVVDDGGVKNITIPTSLPMVVDEANKTATIDEGESLKVIVHYNDIVGNGTNWVNGTVSAVDLKYNDTLVVGQDGLFASFSMTLNLDDIVESFPSVNPAYNLTTDEHITSFNKNYDQKTMIYVNSTLGDTLKSAELHFNLSKAHFASADKILVMHIGDDGSVALINGVYGSVKVIDHGDLYEVVVNSNLGFSSYAVVEDRTPASPVTPSSGGGSSGSSTWATVTPTPTATPTVTPTNPTDGAPTDVPTSAQPTKPAKTPVPIAGIVLGGLAAFAVLRRK